MTFHTFSIGTLGQTIKQINKSVEKEGTEPSPIKERKANCGSATQMLSVLVTNSRLGQLLKNPVPLFVSREQFVLDKELAELFSQQECYNLVIN